MEKEDNVLLLDKSWEPKLWKEKGEVVPNRQSDGSNGGDSGSSSSEISLREF